MVGILIVAHSEKLAAAVEELARDVVQKNLNLRAVGGIDDPEHSFGSDVLAIHQALDEIYSEDGVVILTDLGSTILSAEMAIEMMPEGVRSRVHLCKAPLVEGAVTACVQASIGGNLERVVKEAEMAMQIKERHLASEELAIGLPEDLAKGEDVHERVLRVNVAEGLHARPAAALVAEASRYRAEISLVNISLNKGPINLKSLMELLTLRAKEGDEVRLIASGEEAEEALEALSSLVDSEFDNHSA